MKLKEIEKRHRVLCDVKLRAKRVVIKGLKEDALQAQMEIQNRITEEINALRRMTQVFSCLMVIDYFGI